MGILVDACEGDAGRYNTLAQIRLPTVDQFRTRFTKDDHKYG